MFNTTQRFSWYSSLVTAAFLGVMTLLSGCGGGGVEATNVVAGTLTVSPSEAVAYNGNPVTLYITGGTMPYTATSSDSAVISLPYNVSGSTVVFDAANVTADTSVTITILDSKGATAKATISVKPSVINNTLTVTPDPATPGTGCGSAVCSGLMATVTVQLKNMATPLVGRNVRFDVVQGDYQFITNSNATTFADTITTTTDQNGNAIVRLRANVNAQTQYAILKVTDVDGGSVLQTTFTIAQYTDGAGILSVVPLTRTITAWYNDNCTSGVMVDYLIHGGTPPYTVTSTATGTATVFPTTVLTNGAGFTATTKNQLCGEVTIEIRDATGRYITATLKNEFGTHTATAPTTVPFFITAATITVAAGADANVTAGGGTTPYYVSSSNLAIATVAISGSTITIHGVASGAATVTVTDSLGVAKTIAVTVP